MNSFRIHAAIVLASLMLASCLLDQQSRGGSVVENEVAGTLFVKNGGPAVAAEIRLYPVDYVPNKALIKRGADTVVALTAKTDAHGRYSFAHVAPGQYNVLGGLNGRISYLDSVALDSNNRVIPADTLDEPGSVTGYVALEPNHSPQTAFIQVLGTNLFTVADSSGRFTFPDLAAGDYAFRVVTTVDGYTPYFGNFRARAGKSDTLADSIRLVYTGIPVVRGLRVAAYDTAHARATLAWHPSRYPFLKEYLVFRNDASSLSLPSTPIARLHDTVFFDTLASLAQGGWHGDSTAVQSFEYRVRVRNLSDQDGLAFGSVTIPVIPIAAVRTTLSLQALGPKGSRGTPNDTLALEARWSNPTRANDSLIWIEKATGKRIRALGISGKTGADTCKVILPGKVQPYSVDVFAIDHAGDSWQSGIDIAVFQDVPVAQAGKDTLVTIGDQVRLHGTGTDGTGGIVSREWDIGGKGEFSAVPSGDTVIGVGMKPGSFLNIFRVTNDDGNVALDTMKVTVVQDPPTAHAGPDTVVSISDTLRLHGSGTDGFGTIVKREWNLGPARAFVAVSTGDTTWLSRSTPGIDTLIFRVTDDDGNVASDSIIVRVVNDIPVVKIASASTFLSGVPAYAFTATAQDRGRVVAWDWSLDSGRTYQSPNRGDTLIVPVTDLPGNVALNLAARALDEDGNSGIGVRSLTISKWGTLAKAPDTLYPRLTVALNGKVYYGLAGQTAIQVFNPATKAWNILTAPKPAYGMGVIQGKLIYFNSASTADLYDPVSQVWSPLPPFPSSLDRISTASDSLRLYEMGSGFNIFDAAANTWSTGPTPPQVTPSQVNASAIATYGGKVYLFKRADPTIKAWMYDPDSAAWIPRSATPFGPSSSPWAVTLGDAIYVGDATTVYKYDPIADRWTEKSRTPTYSFGQTAAVLDGKIYMIGWDSVLVYDPAWDP